MNTLLQAPRLTRSDGLLVAAYWLVVAPILLVEYAAETSGGWRTALPMVGATVLFDTVTVALVVGRLLPLLLRRRRWALGLVPVFVGVSGAAYLGLYSALRGHAPNLAGAQVVLGAVAHAKSYGLLAVLLTGQRYFSAQHKLLHLRQTQAESELRTLKAQLDPHFLFNNLNVLRGLLQVDPAEADQFLTEFVALYRTLLRHRVADLVGLAEELRFAESYLYLLQHRFGAAYAFRQDLAAAGDPARLLVVPGTLQLLVENVLKHNVGDEELPLLITIRATATSLVVEHPRRPKLTPIDSLGTGLANLRERYRLLVGQPIAITHTAHHFAVAVPLLARPAQSPPSPSLAR
ncbi:histidine kinase internal region [Hymenobacter roseosalivarius DSM 11622]|uniref:Histidine kinase internal region n=1 Tax=Hymenobacter roseosalivarius DSM 11622 TaxID=645990 RepID=A0A1W1W2P6_9BACT|nr:sensor histidine kinase [Hymenobacter roseosalivarius]SMB99671.1 histidine kinase internal region [Hymenobacter roseosalivarius DSM 11622]